jgi:cyclohexanecarboxylate-CoA ligase
MNPAFEAMYTADYARRMHASGDWRNELLLSCLDRALELAPDRLAIVDHNSMTGRRTTLTYRALQAEVDRIAVGLARLGVGRGEVVSFQLPNWWQFTALHLACLSIGAISNPLMPIFRERELAFMLELAEARVLVVPRLFRGFDYPAMAAGLRARLPALAHVLVVDGTDGNAFERALPPLEPGCDVEALTGGRRPHADEVIELMYTSGTTGEPKGVMHTSNTTFSNVRTFAERLHIGPDDVFLMASPMAHQTGFLYGMVMPIAARATACYQDVWEPAKATDIIAAEHVTFTMGSTPFLADLADAAEQRPEAFASLKTFVSAGAPIPRALVRRARASMRASILSAWGMTEVAACTLTPPEAPEDKAFETDGSLLAGMELRIAAPDGTTLAAGQEGRLLARGCSVFAGYLKRPQLYAFDDDGWFDTGDLARLDTEGYVRITGRAKDLIIRGGENIPVVEIENLLYQHPAVLEAAIVGMPDPRLGERACAFVVTKDGAPLDLPAVTEWLGRFNVSRTYWPERIEVLETLPRTPSGKIQKFQLRERAQSLAPPR